MKILNQFAAMEQNPISEQQLADRKKVKRHVDWTERGLVIDRIRLIGDPSPFNPFYDVSYCTGHINGEPVKVSLPFSQVPKKYKTFLYQEAKKTGQFINGIFDPATSQRLKARPPSCRCINTPEKTGSKII